MKSLTDSPGVLHKLKSHTHAKVMIMQNIRKHTQNGVWSGAGSATTWISEQTNVSGPAVITFHFMCRLFGALEKLRFKWE